MFSRVEALRDRSGDLSASVCPGYAAGEKFVVPSVDVPDVSTHGKDDRARL